MKTISHTIIPAWVQWLETLPEERIYALLIWLQAVGEVAASDILMIRRRLNRLQKADISQIFLWLHAFHLEDAIGYFLCREFDLYPRLPHGAFRILQGKILTQHAMKKREKQDARLSIPSRNGTGRFLRSC